MSASVSAIGIEPAPPALAPEELARGDLYALIATLFYGPPNRKLLAALAAASALGGETDAPLPRAWDDLRRAAAAADPEAVREEFDTCFISIGEAPVMLYASHHLTGYLHEKPLAELRTTLVRLGLGRNQDAREPEDHISAVADVMRHLILSGDGEFETQRDFFTRFIGSWYTELADRMEQVPELVFYRDVGRFTRAFLDVERESFDLESA
jgi:TorA maturation chaperone TorD